MQYRRRRLDVEITYYTYTYIIHRRKSIIRKWERTAKVLAVKKGGERVGGRAGPADVDLLCVMCILEGVSYTCMFLGQ